VVLAEVGVQEFDVVFELFEGVVVDISVNWSPTEVCLEDGHGVGPEGSVSECAPLVN